MSSRLNTLPSRCKEMEKLTKYLRGKDEDEVAIQITDEMNRVVSMSNTLKSMMAKLKVVDITGANSQQNVQTLMEGRNKVQDTYIKAKKAELAVMKELYPLQEENKIKGTLHPQIHPYV